MKEKSVAESDKVASTRPSFRCCDNVTMPPGRFVAAILIDKLMHKTLWASSTSFLVPAVPHVAIAHPFRGASQKSRMAYTLEHYSGSRLLCHYGLSTALHILIHLSCSVGRLGDESERLIRGSWREKRGWKRTCSTAEETGVKGETSCCVNIMSRWG